MGAQCSLERCLMVEHCALDLGSKQGFQGLQGIDINSTTLLETSRTLARLRVVVPFLTLVDSAWGVLHMRTMGMVIYSAKCGETAAPDIGQDFRVLPRNYHKTFNCASVV